MKKTEATPTPKPPSPEITPSLEALLTQDLQAWIAAKEAIQRAMGSERGQSGV